MVNITLEQKELLLKDLYARLPYGVKCEVVKRSIDGEMLFIRNGSTALELTVDNVKELVTNNMYEIKPYLFPLSSMTEDQTKELIKLINTGQNNNNGFMRSLCRIEFYHKHHFDYRGLIKLNLANDSTRLNIY